MTPALRAPYVWCMEAIFVPKRWSRARHSHPLFFFFPFFWREFLVRGCFRAGDLALFTYSNKEVSASSQTGSRFVCNLWLASELKRADETSNGWRQTILYFGVLTKVSWVLHQKWSPKYWYIWFSTIFSNVDFFLKYMFWLVVFNHCEVILFNQNNITTH